MLRVLVVDDSPLISKVLVSLLNSDPEILVAGVASDGYEALRLLPKLDPDLITTDMHMPNMGGEEATKKIMAFAPKPILIISSSVFVKGMDKVFRAMSYGALDIVDKRDLLENLNQEKAKIELLLKIKALAKITKYPSWANPHLLSLSSAALSTAKITAKGKIVGLVASTGGPQALTAILKALPRNFPTPVVVVQHISPGFTEGFADWLDDLIPMKAKLAENGEALKAATVYIASSGLHMTVNEDQEVRLIPRVKNDHLCPSGTLLLESLAETCGKRALGVILTGMGDDGAEGIKAIHNAEGLTLAQDEKTSTIWGMPKEAVGLGGVDEVLPLNAIAPRILKWVLE